MDNEGEVSDVYQYPDKKTENIIIINANQSGKTDKIKIKEKEKEVINHNFSFDIQNYQFTGEKIKEIIVFTKIPKNSIKIPIAGGKTYSPDFAYVLDYENGQKKMYFIVETKDTDKDSLRDEEKIKIKIKHAEKFFGDTIKIKFKTQFKDDDIANLIKEIYKDI